METLEEIYAGLMAGDAERLQCAKPELSGTLEDMYARLMGQDEAVQAANPYGCNQYGEGWKLPHNGRNNVGEDEDNPLRGAKTPHEFLEKLGMDMKRDADLGEIVRLKEQLFSRFPENKKLVKEIVEFSDNADTNEEKERIVSAYEELFSAMSPEVVKALPKVSVGVEVKANKVAGAFGKSRISYKKGVKKEVLFHELVHLVQDSSSDETYERFSDYFRKRIGKGKVVKLTKSFGVKDYFSVSFDPWNDYAGTIDYKVDDRNEKSGAYRKRQDHRNGTEMATTHLEKLARSPENFRKYWNEKYRGRYYWREAFVESLAFLFHR